MGYPTETFFGLGADPRNRDAVSRLVLMKSRPDYAGIPLIIDSAERVEEFVAKELPEVKAARVKLQQKYWPGPLTIIIAPRDGLSSEIDPYVFGPDGSLAIRVSPEPIALELARGIGGVITATSANPRGAHPGETASDVRKYFPRISVLGSFNPTVSAPKAKLPSTIVDVRSLPFRVTREGVIPAAEILAYAS